MEKKNADAAFIFMFFARVLGPGTVEPTSPCGLPIPSSRIVERFWVFNCTVLCKYCRGVGRGGRFRWTCWVWLWRGFPRSNGAPFSIPRTTGETFRFGRVQGKLVFSPCGRRRLTNEKKNTNIDTGTWSSSSPYLM